MPQDSLGRFGVVDDVEEDLAELDAETIPFTLVGYTRKRLNDDGEPDENGVRREREFEFSVNPDMEFGPLFNALFQTDAKGEISVQAAVQFIGDALVADDVGRWFATIRDPEIHFEAELIQDLAEQLAVRYGLRPSAPRSERRGGPRRSGTTPTARRSGTANGSTRGRPRTRSTSSTR
ncbi:MAG: hypothetical protein KGH75_00120 [Rhodospirillales bacterium]|nr:hypothetical protein [Rhodospirillales bacterium]